MKKKLKKTEKIEKKTEKNRRKINKKKTEKKNLIMGSDVTSAHVHQFGHGEPSLEMPKTSTGIEMAVEPHGRLLAQSLGELVRQITATGHVRCVHQEGHTWMQIGAAVMGAVRRIAEDVADAVQRTGRYDGHHPVGVRQLHLDLHRVRVLGLRGVDVGQKCLERLLA